VGDQVPEQQRPATRGEEKKYLTLQTVVILVSLVGSVFAGGKWVVTSSWAQAKEHSDAGIAVLRAEFETHKREETGRSERQSADTQMMRSELYDARKELRALYEWQRTGSPAAARVLEAPLSPPPVPTPTKDAGR
jgi:hypothetical protein